MARRRTWLIASLLVNAALVGAVLWFKQAAKEPIPVPTVEVAPPTNRIRTVVAVRKQPFLWNEVESDDYFAYVKNLRDIGCPPSTVRDIIVADVTQYFQHRQLTEVIRPEHQWWRSEPDSQTAAQAAQRTEALQQERKELLVRLLGPDHELIGQPVLPPAGNPVNLSGPLLGDLAEETKRAVYAITSRAQQKITDLYAAGVGQVDPIEAGNLRLETRRELGALLNADQLEEFLLRYSQTSHLMRQELAGMEFSPEEFRALFRARDPFEQQPEFAYAGNDASLQHRRRELEQQRDLSVRQMMTPDRFRDYQRQLDPLFREARATVQQLGGGTRAIQPVYEVRQVTIEEIRRLQNDQSLGDAERAEAIAEAQREAEQSIQKIIGPPEPAAARVP